MDSEISSLTMLNLHSRFGDFEMNLLLSKDVKCASVLAGPPPVSTSLAYLEGWVAFTKVSKNTVASG